MTVQTSNTVAIHLGNGATTVWPFTFKVIDAEHLIVERRVIATGLVDKTYVATEYSVTGLGEGSGGSVTILGGPLTVTQALVIRRSVPVTQGLDIINQGGFYPETLEDQLDRIVMMIQERAADTYASLRVAGGEVLTPLPDVTHRADRVVGFDLAGQPVVSPFLMSQVAEVLAAIFNPIFTTIASLVMFLQTGIGAVARSVQARLREDIYVTDYADAGVDIGGGSADAGVAIRRAVAANPGKRIFFPAPSVKYLVTTPLGLIPNNTTLSGAGKFATKIEKGFNGDLMELGDGVSLNDMWLAGNGSVYTGRALVVTGFNGNQSLDRMRIMDWDGFCLDFTTENAGSGFSAININWNRTNSSPGTGRYCVNVFDAGVPGPGHPMKFIHNEFGGSCSFSWGSANDVYLANSSIFDMLYSVNTRGVHIATCRCATPTPLTLRGSGGIVGGGFFPLIAIAPGSAFLVLPAAMNLGFDDQTTVGGTLVFDQLVHNYTPVFAAAGASITGAASIQGTWVRNGNAIDWTAKLVGNASTVIPGGPSDAITVTMPFNGNPGISEQTNTGGNINYGGGTYMIGARSVVGDNLARLYATSGLVTRTNPITIPAATSFVITICGRFVR